jgi:hypothetical protein
MRRLLLKVTNYGKKAALQNMSPYRTVYGRFRCYHIERGT